MGEHDHNFAEHHDENLPPIKIPHRDGSININGYGLMMKIHSSTAVAPERLEEMIREVVLGIAKECMENGATAIGHVKTHLKTTHGYARADVVRLKEGAYVQSDLKEAEAAGELTLNSIILGMEKDEIAEITTNVARGILEKFGFDFTLMPSGNGVSLGDN